MPKLQAARVTQCGLDFAVVLVDPKLFMNPSELEAFSERAQALFPGVPAADRQSVVSGQSVSLGGRRILIHNPIMLSC